MASSRAVDVPGRSRSHRDPRCAVARKLRDRGRDAQRRAGTKLDVHSGMRDVATSCLAEYASRGPRYTSYPPATEFGPLAVDRVQDELTGIGARSDPFS